MDRLHNSGWGRPPEQYRTPVLGHAVLLELPVIMGAWSERPAADRTALHQAMRAARAGGTGRPVPLALLAQVAAQARVAVEQRHAPALREAGVAVADTPHVPARPDALVELARLRDRVNALGWTAGIVFSEAPPVADAAPLDWNHPTNADEVALALVAAALLHGTMVLWGAEPELAPLRHPRRLALRWLRPAQAADAARRRWQALLGLGGRL